MWKQGSVAFLLMISVVAGVADVEATHPRCEPEVLVCVVTAQGGHVFSTAVDVERPTTDPDDYLGTVASYRAFVPHPLGGDPIHHEYVCFEPFGATGFCPGLRLGSIEDVYAPRADAVVTVQLDVYWLDIGVCYNAAGTTSCSGGEIAPVARAMDVQIYPCVGGGSC